MVKQVALTGEALLKKVKELDHLSEKEKAKACGYITVTRDGKNRVNMMKFLNNLNAAVFESEGLSRGKHSGRGGRSASYRVSVQKNGNLLIGSTYTQMMGLQPGDELEIRLGRKHIHLRPVNSSLEE
ncbi:MAG: AbrB family transcriptional regulator [Pseudanabaenaceae cyanobacterium]